MPASASCWTIWTSISESRIPFCSPASRPRATESGRLPGGQFQPGTPAILGSLCVCRFLAETKPSGGLAQRLEPVELLDEDAVRSRQADDIELAQSGDRKSTRLHSSHECASRV